MAKRESLAIDRDSDTTAVTNADFRVVVHDYSGHPFQVQLSRGLAERGFTVVHQYCVSYRTGKGSVAKLPGDSPNFHVRALTVGDGNRYAAIQRLRHEIAYGRKASREILAAQPSCVVLSNLPLLSYWLVCRRLDRHKVPILFWHQDLYSAAIASHARQRLGVLGVAIGWIADRCERSAACKSTHIVAISSAFLPVYRRWRIPAGRVTVIPNWAATNEVVPLPKDNAWSRKQGFSDIPLVLYAGTLGIKHDAGILADLAEAGARLGFAVAVVSEGRGRGFLEGAQRQRGLDGLHLFDYQPYDDLSRVLGAADIGLVLLNDDASGYSVPSKALTYLSAGLPIVAVLSERNAISDIVRESGAGVVLPAADLTALIHAVTSLLADPPRRALMSERARQYAESVFNFETILPRFETLVRRACGVQGDCRQDSGLGRG